MKPHSLHLAFKEPGLCDDDDNEVPSGHSEVPCCLQYGLHGHRGLQWQVGHRHSITPAHITSPPSLVPLDSWVCCAWLWKIKEPSRNARNDWPLAQTGLPHPSHLYPPYLSPHLPTKPHPSPPLIPTPPLSHPPLTSPPHLHPSPPHLPPYITSPPLTSPPHLPTPHLPTSPPHPSLPPYL